MLILSISISARSAVLNSQKKLIVYQLNKASATGIIEGRLLKLSVDTALLSDQKNFDYQIGSSMNSFGIKKSVINTFASSAQSSIGNISKEEIQLLKNNMLIAVNKRIVIIDRLPEADSALNKLKTDYLIIRHNPKFKIGQLLRFYTPDWVIFDGSNSKYHTQKWSDECKIAGIKHYSTRDSGAFIADL
jgi:competence protein ComEC